MPGKVFTAVLKLAAEQHGFVRTTDLREAGLDPRRLTDFHRRGLAEHHGYGLYRINLIPPGDMDEFMLATAWPAGRGILCHETALDLHDLCDVNPNHIDITVPAAYRTHREIPPIYRLHHRDLDPAELTMRDGLPIVTPTRAIADAIESGLRGGLITQAIDTAKRRAMITTAAADELRVALNSRAGSAR